MKQNVYRAICSVILVALFLGIVLIEHTQVHAESATYPPAGAVLVSGSQWAGSYASKGDLNVYSNGFAGNPKCPGGNNGTYGCRWQCVELAQRWAAIGLGEPDKFWPNVYIAPDMWSEGPKLPVPFQQHLNGGGDQPQFGDLLIFAGNPGHVAIVKDVQNGHVDIVEQNSVPSGYDSLPINGTFMPLAYGMSIIGWLRSVNSSPPTVTAASDPVVVNGGPNGMDLFVTGTDGRLYHRWYNAGVWAGWENLGQPGAAVVGDVSVLVASPGHAAIFARGSDGGLYIRNSHPGGWDPWTWLASNVGGDPVAAADSGFDSADVYYRDSVTGALDSTWWNGTGWSTASVPASTIAGKPAVYEVSGLIRVFVRGTNGELWSNRFTGSWAGWTDLHGQTPYDPVVSMTRTGELDLYVTGNNASPYWSNTAVGGWNQMPGELLSALTVVGNGPDQMDGFGRGMDSALWDYWWYTGVGPLGGGMQGTAAAIGGSPDPLDVFVRGNDNVVYWQHWNNGWSGFQSMGTQITGSN